MGHIFSAATVETRFEIINEEVCLIYTGVYKDLSYDVYREFADGRCESRNLYSTSFGYQFAVPGEKISKSYYSGYYNQVQKYEEWKDSYEYDFYSGYLTDMDKELICSVYPDFKYVLNKWGKKPLKSQVLLALKLWQKHPMVELLIATKHFNIAFNKTFYRLTEKKQKEIILFLKGHKEDYTLQDVQTMLKYNISTAALKDYYHHRNVCYGITLSYPEYSYLSKTEQLTDVDAQFYRDYKKMLKDSGHNKNDPYWLFPKDVHEMHNRLIEEQQAKKALMEAEKNERYIQKVKDLFRFKKDVDGFEVYVPESLMDWIPQADELHQCILWAKYDDKVINNQNYCLVFIRKEGKPVATAEIIGKEKKIGQFYVNEWDRENCRPSAEIQNVLNVWLNDFTFEKEVA